MRERQRCVTILASAFYGVSYVGVSSNLIGRLMQHRDGGHDGFTRRHFVKRLVYLEVADVT